VKDLVSHVAIIDYPEARALLVFRAKCILNATTHTHTQNNNL